MFCSQCEEAAKGTGCDVVGVCGKSPEVSDLQDDLVSALKNMAKNTAGAETDRFITHSLFMTITNANFDPQVFVERIKQAGGNTSVPATDNKDLESLQNLLINGLKGLAAYVEHAEVLGYTDPELYAFIRKALVATLDTSITADALFGLVIECGNMGVKGMALLDKANTTTYGTPEITTVNLGVRNNPGILISGHDLQDLEWLLEQTKGTGVDVYTHCEMLPAHYYPKFKEYNNFAGNYGGAWWQQAIEFASFNGPILMTTNCITPVKTSYKDRFYTTGAAGYEGTKHIANPKPGEAKDFSAIIAQAKTCQPPTEIETGTLVGGFAHSTLAGFATTIIEAVQAGAIRKFVVMAGCDGRKKEREYYTKFAQELPKDTVILTAGCAKFRYNKLQLGDINGIPRVLDAGQCNDSYSLAVTALKLQEILGLADVNDLPIVYNIAWYEQKAVIVLLALLALGVKNIHLGPTLPAFLTPNIATALVKQFGIAGIGSVHDDIQSLIYDRELVTA